MTLHNNPSRTANTTAESQPGKSDTSDYKRESFRSAIVGIAHCPRCGEMLWPPESVSNLITSEGREIVSPLEADPGEVIWHRTCFEEQLQEAKESETSAVGTTEEVYTEELSV